MSSSATSSVTQRLTDTPARRPRLRPTLAIALGALATLLAIAHVPLFIALDMDFPAQFLLFVLTFAFVGTVVTRHEPSNPIGWLMLAGALLFALGRNAASYAYLDYAVHGGDLPLGPPAVLLSETWIYAFAVLPVIVLIFPAGRVPSGWKWPLRGYTTVTVLYIASSLQLAILALSARIPIDSQLDLYGSGNPRGAAAWAGPMQAIMTLAFGVFCAAAITYQSLQFRRSSGDRRQQLKWLGAGAAVAVSVLLISFPNSTPDYVGNVLAPIALTALPASIGVGILRYRLYEIDRLISRTLSYAIVTGVLIGVFLGAIALTTHVLDLPGRVGVAASTLAAAIVLNPVRLRVQRAVDRRFNRTRYDAQQLLDSFTGRLRDRVELEAIRTELLDAVQGALAPAHLSLWIRPSVARSSERARSEDAAGASLGS